MSESRVKIRIRTGANEIEIEAPSSILKDAVNLIPEMLQKLPESQPHHVFREPAPQQTPSPTVTMGSPIPEIKVEKDDSLTDIIIRIFKDPWGRTPRKLSDVRAVLDSYGLIYPKQSVAVALLRLAQAGKLRRFKGEGGEYVYTASTGLAVDEADSAPTT
ncbi:MAG: hypothetical protein RMJ31_00170 [Nitrososphaerota archaeon]|nr:hypothetical protein [Nitrososphaerales archaeon]MDW8044180.1 hypothetical protein [Nitrososphaerota archaeon]